VSTRETFWSRRRAAVQAEAEAEEKARRRALEAEREAEQARAIEEKTDEELLVELNLPDPDSMKPGDDFSAFMKEVVPDRLRRRALRRLWTSDPALANLDMLVEYGEDYTDSATVVANLQTAYQVGKGMMAHVEKMAEEAEAEAAQLAKIEDAAAPDVTATAQPEDQPSSSVRKPETDQRTRSPEADPEVADDADADVDTAGAEEDAAAEEETRTAAAYSWSADEAGQDEQPRPRRHMRFAFAGTDTIEGADAPKGKD
jgi:hypothetical protein